MSKDKKIKDELQEISPFLAKLKKSDDGFEVPQNYFQNFENNLMARIKAEEEVEKWTPSTAIITEANTSTAWSSRILNWLKTPQVSMSFAMVLVIGVAISIILQPTETNVSTADISIEKAISNVSTEEMLAYVEEHVEAFDETLLSEVVEVEIQMSDDLDMEGIVETRNSTLEVVETEELEQYLEENIEAFDESLIEEEILELEDLDEY